MKLFFEGKDITNDISINTCIHDMFVAGRSDSLIIKFNDTSGLWNSWGPEKNNVVSVEMDSAQTGKMFIHSMLPENGKYSIKAFSVPSSYKEIRSKAWEKIKFLQIVQEIAERHGLGFKHFGVRDKTYEYIIQTEKNDFEFLQERCVLEECAFLVFDGDIIVYSVSYMENQPSSQTLIINPDTKFEFEFCGDHRSGIIWSSFMPKLAAGSVVDLHIDGLSSWNGPIFIQQVRHDYVKFKSKIFFKKPGGF